MYYFLTQKNQHFMGILPFATFVEQSPVLSALFSAFIFSQDFHETVYLYSMASCKFAINGLP